MSMCFLQQDSEQNWWLENLEALHTITPRGLLHGSHMHRFENADIISSYS